MEASRMEDEAQQHKNNYSELELINRRQEERVRYYGTEAFHQTAFYLFLQGLNLVSVSGSVACHLWWIHFSLSLLLFILFALTFTSTVISYVQTRLELDFNVLELQVIRERISMAGSGSSGGDEPRVIKPDKFRAYKLYACVYFVLLVLLAFTVIELYACRSIPCDDDGRNQMEVATTQ